LDPKAKLPRRPYLENDEPQYTTVLEIPPVDSPESAIKVAIAAKRPRIAVLVSSFKSQVDKIRAEIEERGQSIVRGEQLCVLCPDVWVSGQWGAISKVAIKEGWSFTFFPSGSVGFAKL
jgi:hypothetical protein